jgi:hypothetical protein
LHRLPAAASPLDPLPRLHLAVLGSSPRRQILLAPLPTSLVAIFEEPTGGHEKVASKEVTVNNPDILGRWGATLRECPL